MGSIEITNGRLTYLQIEALRLGEGESLQAIERVDASLDEEDGTETPEA